MIPLNNSVLPSAPDVILRRQITDLGVETFDIHGWFGAFLATDIETPQRR
ncbi:hypothetical protein [Sinorhizobium saheli]|nr:hypothetical protein [Sinorhizobium saheli]